MSERDRDCLSLSLLENNVDGNLYNAIKSCYDNTICRVRVNDLVTDYFTNNIGVRQGDSLSPTLFMLFINNLALEIKKSGIGHN